MLNPIKVACIQMTSGPDIVDNLSMAEQFIRTAAGQGAQFILTPENTDQIRFPMQERLERAQAQDEHAGVKAFSALAKELDVSVMAGSFSIKVAADKLANRSMIFGRGGDIIAAYDKIHLFDVDLPNGETYRESDIIQPGTKAVIAETDVTKIGMSICYDVRFPHLYRDLAKAGAEILTVPAAFSMPTGEAHWKTLLRARAIETGAFVIAPGQVGNNHRERHTWGHSLIINPWGDILAEAGTQPEIITADIDLKDVQKARQAIPALTHDREYDFLME